MTKEENCNKKIQFCKHRDLPISTERVYSTSFKLTKCAPSRHRTVCERNGLSYVRNLRRNENEMKRNAPDRNVTVNVEIFNIVASLGWAFITMIIEQTSRIQYQKNENNQIQCLVDM